MHLPVYLDIDDAYLKKNPVFFGYLQVILCELNNNLLLLHSYCGFARSPLSP